MEPVYTFKAGDRFQHYVVESLIGAGFHGEVYAIRHPQTGDRFALKVTRLASRGDAYMVARALNEAKGMYSVQHKNVVRVFDLNCEDDGLVWMRTELLRGQTVQGLLAVQGKLSPLWALSAAIEAAWGLHAIHERQIIHRDVKPANLFYADPRTIKVIDLSIAKVFREGLETTTGRAGLGTPAYSAPEQLEGNTTPDVRFDIYALGIALFEMLTGRHPWADVLDNTQELIRRQLEVMPPRLSDVMRIPRRVDDVVGRAIAKDPSQRYASMMEMGRALFELRAWLADEARAGRLLLRKRMGEPPYPGDADVERTYRPPEHTPAHPLPAPGPAARVVVVERPEGDGASDLANTLPLRKPGNYGGTLPLDGVARTDRGTELLPPAPVAFSATETSPRAVLIPPSAPLLAARETPAAVARPADAGKSAVSRRRLPWGAVILAVVVASAATLAIIWSLMGARGASGMAPPPAAAPPPLPTAPVSAAAATGTFGRQRETLAPDGPIPERNPHATRGT